jgi:hypothetical protein
MRGVCTSQKRVEVPNGRYFDYLRRSLADPVRQTHVVVVQRTNVYMYWNAQCVVGSKTY